MSVEVKSVTYQYDIDDVNSREYGIFDISFKVESGQTIGVIGHTGSGKSTLMQHFNGLYLPQEGCIIIDEFTIDKNGKGLKELRRKVGLVFQYPEDQLFEETVFADIAFGPKNLGLTEAEVKKDVALSMEDIGLSYEDYQNRSPHELSGGEKRKVAIASVLAMNPDILILDEPTAGLDPRSKSDLLSLLFEIKEKRGLTVFFVSHDMDDIFEVADYLLVMENGRLALEGLPEEIFSKREYLLSLGLGTPFSVEIMALLKEAGCSVDFKPLRDKELVSQLLEIFKKGKKHA
ncbi:hypothetical protein AZF37_09510 [endosymbiont 'TC1' of Trimyema compressum]|uniref:energy-coupling factor transporter ATPase n=1 Tax=endosymbiont 'TC1' of Trimyema compressum TaxID=243899 RepID=UPI0007F0DF54|nr:energy-coupling factor transporter ATPase [endosymbiont 'TC1' of Trimyema compressum]AMP21354.1 hypothetical protein AZF37_09510 [endosymbiont 'TC1' of Trimyema compressum]